MIVPGCLGFAVTDKPTDTNLYAYKDQAADMANILDNENVYDTIIIRHDWSGNDCRNSGLANMFMGEVQAS